MKYCNKCGFEISNDSNFCPNCGTNFTDVKPDNNKKIKDTPAITWVVIGLLFPVLGAILYYVLKKTDYKAAKILNICSWIGFLIQGIFIIISKYNIN